MLYPPVLLAEADACERPGREEEDLALRFTDWVGGRLFESDLYDQLPSAGALA